MTLIDHKSKSRRGSDGGKFNNFPDGKARLNLNFLMIHTKLLARARVTFPTLLGECEGKEKLSACALARESTKCKSHANRGEVAGIIFR